MKREASSLPPYEGGNWEGVEVSAGTGPGVVLEPAENGPEYGMAGTLGVGPGSGPEAGACPAQGWSLQVDLAFP